MSIVTPIPIILDKERHLKLTLGGMKRFADATGKSILKNEVDFRNLSEEDTITFLWACLLWEDRNLKLDDVGFMLDFNRIDEIVEALYNAFLASTPGKKETELKNPQSLPTS